MDFEDLYKGIQPRIFAFFFVKTSSREMAEDLTQEVFYEAIKGFHGFSGKSTIETWLFAIAKNRLKKHYRSQKYQRQLRNMLDQEEKRSFHLKKPCCKKSRKQDSSTTSIGWTTSRGKL